MPGIVPRENIGQMNRILVVDDEVEIGKLISRLLSGKRYEIETVTTGKEALSKVENPYDLVLLDIGLPDISGMDVLREIKRKNGDIPVVMITGYGRIDSAVRCIKAGAIDFIEKPFQAVVFRNLIMEILKSRETSKRDDFGIIGSSPKIQKAKRLVDKFALSDLTVLLHGESGTGKEIFARAIHEKSKRREGPFVPLDCATFSENLIESDLFGHEKGSFTGATEKKIGKFERADRGTLFIDEVENLTPSVQAKLLRAVQEKQIERVGGDKPIKVDVRILAATNVDIRKAVNKGYFRHDLYYRLSQVQIDTPPLREMTGDIDLLISHLLDQCSKEFGKTVGISSEALNILKVHNWPGNVRELENVVKSAAILAEGDVKPEHLPDYLKVFRLPLSTDSADKQDAPDWARIDEIVEKGLSDGHLDLKPLIKVWTEKLENAVIKKVVEISNLKKNELARFLNIDPKTLRSKTGQIGLISSRENRLPKGEGIPS